MKIRTTLSGLILILMVTVNIAYATETVFQIQDGDNDLFMTTSGAIFKTTELIVIMDPNYDTLVFLRFTGVTIPWSANINEAILSFKTASYYNDSATGLDVTIYGIKQANCPAFGDTADLNMRPVTTNYKNWDISNVKGTAWHNVTVTNILSELVIQYGYTSGNALGFKILCDAEGYQRTIKGYEYTASEAVKLYVTYNVAPPSDPSDQANPPYNDTEIYTWTWWKHYKCYDIWNVTAPEIGPTCFSSWNVTDDHSIINVTNCTLASITLYDLYWENERVWTDGGTEDYFQNFIFQAGFKVTRIDSAAGAGNRLYGIILTTYLDEARDIYLDDGDYITMCIRSVASDNQHWTFSIWECNDGVITNPGSAVGTYKFNLNTWIYIRIQKLGSSYKGWAYSDPDYTSELEDLYMTLTEVRGFRYLHTLHGGHDGSTTGYMVTSQVRDFNGTGLAWSEPVFFVTDNGTLVDLDPTDDPEDLIDDIVGPDPEDPEPDIWEGDPIGRFRLRLSFLIMGFTFVFVPIWFFSYRRPSAESVIGGVLVMLIGLAFLITVGQI